MEIVYAFIFFLLALICFVLANIFYKDFQFRRRYIGTYYFDVIVTVFFFVAAVVIMLLGISYMRDINLPIEKEEISITSNGDVYYWIDEENIKFINSENSVLETYTIDDSTKISVNSTDKKSYVVIEYRDPNKTVLKLINYPVKKVSIFIKDYNEDDNVAAIID